MDLAEVREKQNIELGEGVECDGKKGLSNPIEHECAFIIICVLMVDMSSVFFIGKVNWDKPVYFRCIY